MTIEDIKQIGLPIDDVSPADALIVESAFEWVLANTTLEFDMDNPDELKALPSCVKLFVMKFCDVMKMPVGVTSESIEGMSQSFDTTQKSWLIRQYAEELLGDYLKSTARVIQACNRWN